MPVSWPVLSTCWLKAVCCTAGAQLLARPEDLVEMLEGADPDLDAQHARAFYASGSLSRCVATVKMAQLHRHLFEFHPAQAQAACI